MEGEKEAEKREKQIEGVRNARNVGKALKDVRSYAQVVAKKKNYGEMGKVKCHAFKIKFSLIQKLVKKKYFPNTLLIGSFDRDADSIASWAKKS